MNHFTRRLAALVVAFVLPQVARAQGYICAEGGGGFSSGAWAEPVIKWMLEKGKGGPVVILSAPPEEAEPAAAQAAPAEPDRLVKRFQDLGASAVTDLKIGKDDGNRPEIAGPIEQARVIFIRGGSQTRYVNGWRGTRTEAAIRKVFKDGGVVGGTSAGCAVLGEVIYDAQTGSLASRDILRDARHAELTLATGFLELTPGVLFDTHFTERARLARCAVMLARANTELKRDVIAIGMDAQTALCVGPDGQAEIMGQGSATVLRLTHATRTALEAGQPPSVTDLAYTQLIAGYGYDLKERKVTKRPPDARLVGPRAPANAAVVRTAPAQGDMLDQSDLGAFRVSDRDDIRALLDGRLQLTKGKGDWAGCILQTRTFEDRPFLENRIGGVQWALAQHPGLVALWLTNGCDAWVDEKSAIRVIAAESKDPGGAPSAALVLDTTGVRSAAFSKAMTRDRSERPRQSVAIEDARLHVLAPGWSFLLPRAGDSGIAETGTAIAPRKVSK